MLLWESIVKENIKNIIISINRITEYYIGEMNLNKKSVSKFVIIVGLICIILGIVLAYFSYWTVGSFLALLGFLLYYIVLD